MGGLDCKWSDKQEESNSFLLIEYQSKTTEYDQLTNSLGKNDKQ